jgi:hypothetical protein
MAIPKPKPDLPDELWVESVTRGVCVHIALGLTPDGKFHADAGSFEDGIIYHVPHSDRPWMVCSVCAEELDWRLLEPSRNGWGRYCGREGIGREDRKRYDWSSQ